MGHLATPNVSQFDLQVDSLLPPSSPALPRLKSLALVGMGLHIFPGSVSGALTSLTHLDLSRNDFMRLPPALSRLTALQQLNMSQNSYMQLREIDRFTLAVLPQFQNLVVEDEFLNNFKVTDIMVSLDLMFLAFVPLFVYSISCSWRLLLWLAVKFIKLPWQIGRDPLGMAVFFAAVLILLYRLSSSNSQKGHPWSQGSHDFLAWPASQTFKLHTRMQVAEKTIS